MTHDVFHPAAMAPSSLSPDPLWVVIGPQGILVRGEEERAYLPSMEELQELSVSFEFGHYLGRLGARDCLTVGFAGSLPEGFSYRGLRALYHALEEPHFDLAGRAVQILEWHRTHRFCGACGSATEAIPGERAKSCPECGMRFYPRLSPAVIVLVERGDEILLARAAKFSRPIYSTLAGFVEAGESLEETVAREIREEVGVEVTNLRYFGSQPWPFPNSLMIGFKADYLRGEIRVDGEEIVDAGWFKAEALPDLPGPPSIARKLIDSWLRERGALDSGAGASAEV